MRDRQLALVATQKEVNSEHQVTYDVPIYGADWLPRHAGVDCAELVRPPPIVRPL